MDNQKIEVVKEIDYLGVTLDSSGEWSKQKAKQKVPKRDPVLGSHW
jgi:hypothetical protein